MGIVRTDDARKLAYDADLDLVEVAPKAKPPVAKIMDYGKYKYEQDQKAREARKNQQQTVVKEQKFRPKIDEHDYQTKKNNVERFLEKGNTVLVIEHNLDVVKSADWIIDMGPEGGSGGGTVVAQGTPEDVAQVEGSFTGEYLQRVLV